MSAQASLAIPEFRRSTQVFPGSDRTWQTAFGDLDADGDLDAVLASLAAPSCLLIDDGEGRFTVSGQTFPGGMHGIAIGDLDGDLDAHLLCASVIYLNDGLGSFTRSSRPVPSLALFSDLNSDGFFDILHGEVGEGFRTYLNDQTGRFSEYHFLPRSELAYSNIALADIDNDGDTDAVYMDGVDGRENSSGVLLNDGTDRSRDGGQDDDVLLTNTRTGNHGLWLNQLSENMDSPRS